MKIVPPVHVLALVLVVASALARAQSEEEPATEALPTVLEGHVSTPEGWPVGGAVVVSSAGGQAVSEADGSFRLHIELPLDSLRVHVTALHGSGTSSAAGSLSVLVVPGGVNPAGVVTLTPGSSCQPGWLPTFGQSPGATDLVHALAVFDDGGGPALYAGGEFDGVVDAVASRIARWDGTSWSPLGSGISSSGLGGNGTFASVIALAVHDDGSGPALYAGGEFDLAGGSSAHNVARWNGSAWSGVGPAFGQGLSSIVHALTVFDDGSGPALYAGGEFTSTSLGATVNHVARWDGTSWSALGSGTNGTVYALAAHDDGGGPALYAGGAFTTAGGLTRNRIAKWNGSSWLALGSGMNDAVRALTVFDDGGGPALHAGGAFTTAGGQARSRIAKWSGSSWVALGSGMNSTVLALTVFDDGSGPALHAGGAFTSAGGIAANRIAKWNGTGWLALGSGMNGPVEALTVFDDGSGGGPALLASGTFSRADGAPALFLAKWSGAGWLAPGNGIDDTVSALAVFDDGGGPALHVGGSFSSAGGGTKGRIAKWNGASWEALGSGVGFPGSHVYALAVFDDGGGPALYAGGNFPTAGGTAVSHIARWNGASWSALAGGGTNNSIFALTVFDDGSGAGPALYAGGGFTSAGGAAANRIASWNGTAWSPLGSGMNDTVSAFTVFDDGGGPALHAGGNFTSAGGTAASNVARWNGAGWSPLGGGMNGTVLALTVFDDGGGAALYAGGTFTSAGGAAANRVARWNGATWSPLGSGMDSWVGALTVFDDGGGPALHAGGNFTSAGGAAANRVARWNGSSWSPLGSGTNGAVLALAILDEGAGAGPALHAGGSFLGALDSGDSYVARWQGCLDTNAPVLSCPTFVVKGDKLSTPPGEVVTFSVTASDNRDPSPTIVCVPPSGSFFPRGTTLVTCTATDAAGNQASCAFPVTVQPKFQRQ